MPQQSNKSSTENNPYTYSNENPYGPRNVKRREQGLPPKNSYDENYKDTWWGVRKGSFAPEGKLSGWWQGRKDWEKKK